MFLTNVMIAIGLSMDAFSLAILYGTSGIKKKNINKLSIVVGVYHFCMPVIGFFVGKAVLNFLPMKPDILVGGIFLILALQMFLSAFKEEEVTPLDKIGTILLFGLTVSIDSFTVGIGLGTISDHLFLPPLIFSITSFLFTFMGLKLGKFLNKSFGLVSTIIGSIILMILSFIYIF